MGNMQAQKSRIFANFVSSGGPITYPICWSRRAQIIENWEAENDQVIDTSHGRFWEVEYALSRKNRALELFESYLNRLREKYEQVLIRHDSDGSSFHTLNWIITDPPSIFELFIDEDMVKIQIHTGHSNWAEREIEAFKEHFKELTEPTESDVVKVSMAFKDPSGPGSTTYVADIRCPSWSEVKENYPRSVRDRLEGLMTSNPEDGMGNLMIWNGPPGTGKTYCIRSLIGQWRDHYWFVNIADSDNFLEHMDYYYSIVERADNPVMFILEDSADSLLSENRALYGSRISKLLNMTDGLLAQGREDIFLVTFNQPIRGVDPAVTRPGRCRARIEFTLFEQSEARDWLARNGGDPSLVGERRQVSLADLYSMLAGVTPEEIEHVEDNRAGFRSYDE